MKDSDQVHQQFLALRASINNAQLATLAGDVTPQASYAPLVWFDKHCYLFLSELASHTRNLRANPSISLILIEDQNTSANAFARRRISLQGKVEAVSREDELFARVLAEFEHNFGDVMQIIEPLPDFHLFRVVAERGRFIRGFGQAYELVGDNLDQLEHVDPRK